MNRTRQRLADAIIRNGGYSDFALEWNVSCYGSTQACAIRDKLCGGEFFISLADLTLRFPNWEKLYDRWNDSSKDMWSHIIENMQEGVKDCDTYRMWSPDTAKKHGFDYKGPGAEVPFDVTFEFHGRGGKHLVVTEFEGTSLQVYNGAFAERLTDPVENDYYQYTNDWCRKLLGMIEEWDKCFTSKAADEEFAYLTAWQFGNALTEGELEAELEEAEQCQ